jgi:hypothetical protein
MKQPNSLNRTRKVTVRFGVDEYRKIYSSFRKTTKRKLSEYIRAVLLNKPITVYTRNQSLDDFVSELIGLKNELSAIGNNFNQAVKKLHTLDHISEIRTWALMNESCKGELMQKVEEIKEKMAKISELWLQK